MINSPNARSILYSCALLLHYKTLSDTSLVYMEYGWYVYISYTHGMYTDACFSKNVSLL